MKRTIIFFVAIYSFSQAYFFVQFADKGSPSAYSTDRPEEFLSDRAIARREAQNIAIDTTDFPVHDGYLQAIKNIGWVLHSTSRWLNGATFFAADTTKLANVRELPFVIYTQKTHEIGTTQKVKKNKFSTSTYNYGKAKNQAKMLKIDSLHNLGFRGENRHIAVIDAGFQAVDKNPGFEHFRNNGQLLGTASFTIDKKNIFAEQVHGSNVLSTIVGYSENQFVGTAPNASCWLIQSEINETESLIEVDNWVAAAEFADSVGVDIISSSLGYSKFDDQKTNFTYQDMNGRTARNTIAATMAAEKGILVIVSAGNEGTSPWHYITSPADANGILTVGAVDSLRQKVDFSSFGPTADGRTKPEVVAIGKFTTLLSTEGSPFYANGTSYSTPIIAGAAACLWQALPTLTSEQIRQLICSHASQSSHPDNKAGYGIPNFYEAYYSVKTEAKMLQNPEKIVLPTLVENNFLALFHDNATYNVEITDMCGRTILAMKNQKNSVRINCSSWAKGIYCVKIFNSNSIFAEKIVKK